MTEDAAPRPARPGSDDDPSLVGLVATAILDAELAALVWLLVEGGVPLVVAGPPERLGAATQLLRGVLASVRADLAEATIAAGPLDRVGAWQLVRGGRSGAVLAGASLEDVRDVLSRAPFLLSPQELTFLGCVLVLGRRDDRRAGSLRVTAAHYVRPFARDAQGHPQELPPAVLATWDARLGRYEHFAWGVLPEIAARLGRRAGDLEADLHHRRDDIAGLAGAGITALDEVRRLVAGYRAAYGQGHAPAGH